MRLTPFKILFIIVILVLLYSDFTSMIRTIKKKSMITEREGFEPTTFGFGDQSSTN